MNLKGFVKDGLDWYAARARDFPWRVAATPYGIWICETMSQQTQMSRVVPFWQRWMDRFPTVAHLADAEPESVIEAWQGLGYYSRARNLHRAARLILQAGFDDLPDDDVFLSSLPGVGPYTLGALGAIAFDRPAVPLDGNLRRVWARVTDEADPISTKITDARFSALTLAAMKEGRPSSVAQMLMDLGAGPCAPSARCVECPVTAHCAALAAGTVGSRPVTMKKTKIRRRYGAALLGARDGKVALRRRPEGGLWGGFLELPWVVGTDETQSPEVLALALAGQQGALLQGEEIERQVLRYTSWQVTLGFFTASGLEGDWLWLDEEDIKKAPLPAGMRRGLLQWFDLKKSDGTA